MKNGKYRIVILGYERDDELINDIVRRHVDSRALFSPFEFLVYQIIKDPDDVKNFDGIINITGGVMYPHFSIIRAIRDKYPNIHIVSTSVVDRYTLAEITNGVSTIIQLCKGGDGHD